jgi:hypothetical protein
MELVTWMLFTLGMKAKEMDQKFQAGIDLWNQGKSQEGAEIWMDLAELGHLESIEQLVYIFFDQKDFDFVETLISFAKDPNEPIILYLKARKIEESVDFEESIKSFEFAVKSGSADACRRLFNAAIYNLDIVQAEIYLEKLRNHPAYFANPYVSVTFDDLNQELVELKLNQQPDDFDSDEEDIDDDFDENFEIWTRYEKYALGDKKSKAELKRSDEEYYELFENLSKLDLLDIWIEWTRSFDFQREVTKRHEEIGDQFDYLHRDDETGEEFDSEERLAIDHKFLPRNVASEFLFNIESGDCSISARKPRSETVEIDESEDERSGYYLYSRIDCLEHMSSKECFNSKCSAAAITVGSGLGDGVYQTATYIGQDGQIESAIALFYWFSEDDDYLSSLLLSGSGIGFLENHIPIILGEIRCEGELTFGDSAAWATSENDNDLEDFMRVSFQVPADDYLIIGWLNADRLESDYNRTFILGAYRGSLKKYFLNLAEAYPAIKNFEKIFAERGHIDC